MTRMTRIFVACLTLALSGCASTWYSNKYPTDEAKAHQLKIDDGLCQGVSYGSVPMPDVRSYAPARQSYAIQGNIDSYNPQAGYSSQSFTGTMRPKSSGVTQFTEGFEQGAAFGSVIASIVTRRRVYDSCMLRLGWSDKPVEQDHGTNNKSKTDTAEDGFSEGIAAYGNGDYATALQKLQPLAAQGEAGAQVALGVMYDKGQGVPQDSKEAVKWYRLAAGQGVAGAQSIVASRHLAGLGVPQDFNEASKWYRLAAEQGDSGAQTVLGAMYSSGRGVPQDNQKAVTWYRLAADQGDASGQYSLGVMYVMGKGVPQDFNKAVTWFRLAADQGNSDAQFFLGKAYDTGAGAPKSRTAAYALYNLSATNGSPGNNTANNSRTILTKQMTTKEIEAGQALSREMAKPKNLLNALDQHTKEAANQ